MSIELGDGLANQTLDRVLEDLLVRFVVNVPDEDLSSIERVFFQVEEAHWFYLDFVRQLNPELPSMKMKTFSARLLEKCPLLWKWGDPADALARFGRYKSTIPVRGVALFNEDLTKVLLVKGTESNAWSFPRGKISKDESDVDCAVREVREEIGFDCRPFIDENDFVERTIKGKNYKIFFVKNIPESTKFEPIARFEISDIKWFDIKSLPKKVKNSSSTYFIVGTMLKPLLKWVNKSQGPNGGELILQLEQRLKKLMGLNISTNADSQVNSNTNEQKQKSVEVPDAGRELLNILQRVNPNAGKEANDSRLAEAASKDSINILLPPSIQTQLPMFTEMRYQPQYPGQSFQNLYQPQYQHQHQHQFPQQQQQQFFEQNKHQQTPTHNETHLLQQAVAPNPDTFKKPYANLGELLSILRTQSDKKESNYSNNNGSSNNNQNSSTSAANIHSKAQQLLSVFPKKSKAPENFVTDQMQQTNKIKNDPISIFKDKKNAKPNQNASAVADESIKSRVFSDKSGRQSVDGRDLEGSNYKTLNGKSNILSQRQLPSNEIEESIRSSYKRQPQPGKKVKLLKRSDNLNLASLFDSARPKSANATDSENDTAPATANESANVSTNVSTNASANASASARTSEIATAPEQSISQSQPLLLNRSETPVSKKSEEWRKGEYNRAASADLMSLLTKKATDEPKQEGVFALKEYGLGDTRDNTTPPILVSPTKDFLRLLQKPSPAPEAQQTNKAVGSDSILQSPNGSQKHKDNTRQLDDGSSASKLLSLLGKKPLNTKNNDHGGRFGNMGQVTTQTNVWGNTNAPQESNFLEKSMKLNQPITNELGNIGGIDLKTSARSDATVPSFEDFQDFEDFEDFEDFQNFLVNDYIYDEPATMRTYRNFDVESDDE